MTNTAPAHITATAIYAADHGGRMVAESAWGWAVGERAEYRGSLAEFRGDRGTITEVCDGPISTGLVGICGEPTWVLLTIVTDTGDMLERVRTQSVELLYQPYEGDEMLVSEMPPLPAMVGAVAR